MQAIVLAAGESSRFWPLNKRHKSLIKIAGKAIIQYTIEELLECEIKDIVVVQSKKKDVEEVLKKTLLASYIKKGIIKFVEQEEALGMGNALIHARNIIKKDPFLVVNPERIDCNEFIPEMMKKSKKSKVVIAGSLTTKPWLYGIMEIENDKIISIVEKPKEPSSNIKIAGIYLLPFEFFDEYEKVNKHMYDFEDALQSLITKYEARVVLKTQETISLKYPWDLFSFARFILDSKIEFKKNKKKTKEISKNSHIEGDVIIGEGTKIYENATIRGPCYIGKNCIIGNNALIREYTTIEDNCIIGANTEITRSILQENVSIHSGFLGDSVIGKNTSIGAGLIVANKRLDRKEVCTIVKGEKINTGLKALGAIIGEDVKIGIRASIMPGSMIGNNAIIGPNAFIKGVIKDNEIFNF